MPRFLNVLVLLVLATSHADATVVYENDFEKVEVGEVPDDFLVLEGEFAVKEVEGGGKGNVLELPGTPVNSFATLFGEADSENLAVAARIRGESKKRLKPAMAVGLNGVSGYRLQITPAARRVELYRHEIVEASLPYKWKSGEWVSLRLEFFKSGDAEWTLRGKVWKDSEKEPSDWTLTYLETEKPFSGKPSIWGMPFSEKPILFDDLLVERIGKEE